MCLKNTPVRIKDTVLCKRSNEKPAVGADEAMENSETRGANGSIKEYSLL